MATVSNRELPTRKKKNFYAPILVLNGVDKNTEYLLQAGLPIYGILIHILQLVLGYS